MLWGRCHMKLQLGQMKPHVSWTYAAGNSGHPVYLHIWSWQACGPTSLTCDTYIWHVLTVNTWDNNGQGHSLQSHLFIYILPHLFLHGFCRILRTHAYWYPMVKWYIANSWKSIVCGWGNFRFGHKAYLWNCSKWNMKCFVGPALWMYAQFGHVYSTITYCWPCHSVYSKLLCILCNE